MSRKTDFVPTTKINRAGELVTDVHALLTASLGLPEKQQSHHVLSTGEKFKAPSAFEGLAIWAKKGQHWVLVGTYMLYLHIKRIYIETSLTN